MNGDSIRELERSSIRGWLEQAAAAGHLGGTVLDYGCGRQPYRDVVEAAGGDYHAFDRAWMPGNVSEVDVDPTDPALGIYDAILCTQVIQYADDPHELLLGLFRHLRNEGVLVLTGPTNWPEVEQGDLQRFTLAGVRRLLAEVGFQIDRLEHRAFVEIPGFRLPIGYGAVARA